MRIKVTDQTKSAFYMSEQSQIDALQKAMEDVSSFKDEAESAVCLAAGRYVSILSCTAEATKNTRLDWDHYGTGSGYADVWLWIKAFNAWDGFFYIGCYLSDIWNLSSENREETLTHFYTRHYVLKDD